jgi:hypothetical protein
LREELPGDAMAGPEDREQTNQLPEEFGPRYRDSGRSHETGHRIVKYSSLHLQPEEIRIVRVERWIELRLDSRQVDSVVFEPRMVAHDGETDERKEQDGQNPGVQEMVPQDCNLRAFACKNVSSRIKLSYLL